MSKPGMTPVTGKKPSKKTMTARSLSIHLDGPEKAYPVYPFSRRVFTERPRHNPFKDL